MRCDTYMSLLVQLVVCELELVEIDDSVHPMAAQVRRVWVHIKTSWRTLLLEAFDPGRVLVFVSILVDRRHVHEQDVGGVWIEIKELHFERRKHTPVMIRKKEKGYMIGITLSVRYTVFYIFHPVQH